MAGFENDVMYAKNADFTQTDNQAPVETNGLITDGDLWVGSTALNAGSTHINVGNITSPGGSISVGYSSPNITLDVSGGGTAIEQITVDNSTAPGTNPVVPLAGNLIITGAQQVNANLANVIQTHSFAANSFAVTIQRADASAAADVTQNGVAHFDSAAFDVDANGFVQLNGGAVAIQTIAGDTGSISGNAVTIFANQATLNAGSSVSFNNTGTTSTFNVTDSDFNTIIGRIAGKAGSTGQFNSALGRGALASLTSSPSNVAIGFGVLPLIAGGFGSNTALGTGALTNLVTGAFNIVLGLSSGSAYTGAETQNILINNPGILGESNTIRIGDSFGSQQTRAFIAGIATVATSNTQTVTIDTVTGQLGSVQGMPMQWSVVTGTTQAGAVNRGYIANNAGLVTVTLPATSAVGDTIAVTGINNATGWRIAQNAGNTIFFGTSTTTPGVGGSLSSAATRDSVMLLCVTANATWNVLNSVGNLTVV